jgi:signal transduction histidine kinase/ligand-binding sensor domain-containing protein/CheY-like chemotaxis protein
MWLQRFHLILNAFVYCFISLFFYTSFTLNALDPNKAVTQYSVQVWDMEDGLPGNSVQAIRQTRDGYLWLGTRDGLVRFDGVDFELFSRGKSSQLKGNDIRSLYEDRHGNLWIGSSAGGLTRYKDGTFTTYPVSAHKALAMIRAIEEDRWGNLWIGSYTHGLTCLSNGQFTTYTTTEGLPDIRVRFIYKDGNRDLWAATYTGIVKVLSPGNFQVFATQGDLPGYKTVCLYDTETKELWIGTTNRVLVRLKNDNLTVFGKEEGLSHSFVTYLYKDRMKNLWIGTDGGGLTRMRDGIFSTLSTHNGLADGFISSIYEDREGSLWLGTLDGGIHQLKDSKITTYTRSEGLTHNYVRCIYESRAGDIWIGTKRGLNRLKKGAIRTLPFLSGTGELLENKSVASLFEDRAGYLWIGTRGGLYRLKEGLLTALTNMDGLSDNRITCMMEDSRGNTWIGTENGLNRFDSRKGKMTVFTKKEGLSSPIIRFIIEDSRGILLTGTRAGLNYLKNGTFSAYKTAAGMEHHSFRCALEDHEGVLWFGMDSGLIRLKENKTTLYTVQSGLIGNYVHTILEGERGYLWLGGRNGISKIRKKELEDFAEGKIHRLHPVWYNEKDGMKTSWCNDGGCKSRDGRLWFPTSMGAAVIDPGRMSNSLPSAIIKRLMVDGEPVNIYSRVLEKNPLQLEPGIKRLEFYYTGMSFINPGKIRFKLKLDGYDHDWLDMGNNRSTTYTGLSPGLYTFRVTAVNPDGAGNGKDASFSFYVQPYFYQTAWFYAALVLFGILMIFSFYRYRFRRFRARQKELDALVERRTRSLKEQYIELEKAQQKVRHSKELIETKNRLLEEQSGKLKEMDIVKSRFFTNISHEFRTPLTLILGPLEQMIAACPDRAEERKKSLTLMLNNAHRLLRLIDQLLELSKLDSGKMKLQAAKTGIIAFIKDIIDSFRLLAEQKELDLVFFTGQKDEEEDMLLYIDPRRMEDIMCNLLMNAVKFTPRVGKITVTVTQNNAAEINLPAGSPGFVEISVSDTGPGIPIEQSTHIFDRFYQADSTYELHEKGSGIGLALAKELVELHHGTIDVRSREGKGTEFIIRIPIGDAHLKPGEIIESPGNPYQPGKRGVPTAIERDVAAEAAGEETLVTGKDIILVVEDSADVRDYIRGELEPLYTVVDARDGREGIDKAQEIVPDLIISDIMMPRVDGYELVRTLKGHINTSHIPIILLTAKASEESIIQGLETRADDYITKPFSTKILNARIKNLIDLRRQLQQSFDRDMTLQPVKMELSPIDKEFIKEVNAAIVENISDPDFNVDALCKKLYMSRSNVYRKIQALSGETLADYIRSYRLKQGAKLLLKGSMSVLEVAFEVGFSSASYFTKCFKKKFHRLPSEL